MTHASKWLVPALGALALPTVTLAAHAVAIAPEPIPFSLIQDDDPEEEFEWLQEEYSNAFSAWLGKLNAAQDEEAREALMAARPANEIAPLFLVFAEKHPRTEYAWEALSWVASQVQEGEHLATAVQTLARDHATDERLVDICFTLRASRDASVSRGLRAIAEKSPHHEVKGSAMFSLGVQLKLRAAMAEGEAAETLLAEFGQVMQSVQDDFADVDLFGTPLATWAAGEVFEHKNLQIGMPAPNIQGEDVDGVPFQLADYRGKVVMLDFWGHW